MNKDDITLHGVELLVCSAVLVSPGGSLTIRGHLILFWGSLYQWQIDLESLTLTSRDKFHLRNTDPIRNENSHPWSNHSSPLDHVTKFIR